MRAYQIITLSILLALVLATLSALIYNVNYNDCKLYARSLEIGYSYTLLGGCEYKINFEENIG